MLALKRIGNNYQEIIKIDPKSNGYIYFGRVSYKYFVKQATSENWPGMPNCQFIQANHIEISRVHVKIEIKTVDNIEKYFIHDNSSNNGCAVFRDDPFSSKRYDIKWTIQGKSMELALNDMIRLSPLMDKSHPFTYKLMKFDDLTDTEKSRAESGLCFRHDVIKTPTTSTTTSSAEKRKLQQSSTSTISPEQSTLIKKIKPSDSIENLSNRSLPRVSFSELPSTASRNPESVTIPASSVTLKSDSQKMSTFCVKENENCQVIQILSQIIYLTM